MPWQTTTTHFNKTAYQKELLLDFIAEQPKAQRKLILKALTLAAKAHENQSRDEGIPYIIHPMRVALSLAREFHITAPEIIAAALLHDVVEDTEVTLDKIQKKFGEEIAELVNNLTRRRGKHETETQKRKNKPKKFKKLMRANIATRLIKCADLLDNVRSWPFIPTSHPSRQKLARWCEEAERYYIPLAEKTNLEMANALKRAFAAFHKRLSH